MRVLYIYIYIHSIHLTGIFMHAMSALHVMRVCID